ncbi:MAG: TRAM domain-containing protein [Chloroflexi bacterium]|jgi:uncharacterized protein YacL|nr:TRAM domain-containing protein [Chloroflexota bacterium]
MSIDLISRIVGFIVFGSVGGFFGGHLGVLLEHSLSMQPQPVIVYYIISTVLFAILGFIIAPWISVKPINALRKNLSDLSAQTLVFGIFGLVVGLVLSALLAYPLSLLGRPFGNILPVVTTIVFGYLGVITFVSRQKELRSFLRIGGRGQGSEERSKRTSSTGERCQILVDTSTIIDGRIYDIARTGFLPGELLIPRFVLNELQYVSDSADNLRRQRGRRGMEVLSELQKDSNIPVTISDLDVEGVREVDDRLVVLARQLNCPILTNDYNLNRIAELQGVKVLNINELANAVKAILLPGESLEMAIIQEGKEYGQGVGYMEDGTMVVVEDGNNYIGKTIKITVTKVLQTAAGRMIFAKPD